MYLRGHESTDSTQRTVAAAAAEAAEYAAEWQNQRSEWSKST